MRILNRADIHALADVALLIPAIREAMLAVSEGRTDMPLRSMIRLAEGNLFGIMTGAMKAGAMTGPAVHGAKLLSLYPGNPAKGRSSHCGVVVVFDAETGLPSGCIDAAELTALRTAAASAVATAALAAPGAARLALIGCGEQAGVHIAAMRAVRPVSDVAVWGRDAAKAAAFAERHGIRTAPSVAAALEGADLVVSATPAAKPLVTRAMLRPGVHLNAVGASIPTMQELESDIPASTLFVTDYRPSLEAQAAEVIAARREGKVALGFAFAEIGEVLAGTRAGRASGDDVTVYRSLGVAAQDLAGALALLARAEAQGVGTVVDWS
jgi:ornithine cyclodeaminase